MIISDDYINSLFEGTNFGELVNGCVDAKRRLIAKTLQNQLDGFWSGSTAYYIAIRGGFLYDAKFGTEKKLTAFGLLFMLSMVDEGKK